MNVDRSVDDGTAERAEFHDVLLTDAALGRFRRFVPGRAGVDLTIGLVRRPGAVARRAGSLAREIGRIAAGRSDVEPRPKDRRFVHPAWSSNPGLRRILQAYLATAAASRNLVEDADLEWPSASRIDFIADNVIQAAAPTNFVLTNPQAWRAAIDTQGTSLVRGAINLARDVAQPPRIPRAVGGSAYRVGESVAATTGWVVHRTELFELIQYTPQTRTVLATPVVIVPPTINRFYALDLAPGRSLVEYLVRHGIQVFMIAWRNPDARYREWGIDTYARGVLDVLDEVALITGADRAVVFGACSGGILSAMTAAHLAATGEGDRLAGLTLVVTVLDQTRAGPAAAMVDRRSAALAAAASARKGFLDGRALAEVFAWLRPEDLIWSYWVNNYLLGQEPQAFDILFWNADVTRMPARLHRDFLGLAVDNALVRPGAASLLDTPVDLGAVKTDAYVLAGIADHLCAWESCYRTAHLLGGDTRFVLSTSGHVAAIVNPPGNTRASYRVAEHNPTAPTEFLDAARTEAGTWWADYVEWLRARCGPEIEAPTSPGCSTHEPLMPAPGSYVLEG
jgi:polyhydroxyalkanoate synthase